MLAAGDVVDGRFEILGAGGAGAMGVVHRARDRRSGEPVALKVLVAGDRERFRREARALAALAHPGIVRHVADGDLDDGAPYLALEWLEGETLAARLSRDGPLAPDDAIALARGAASALAAAHRVGLVHRDISPDNLFLVGGRAAAVKVLDFGAVRLRDAESATITRGTLGTPGYMAPEQARGDRDIDARADVFSLGLILHECLTGRPAFVAVHESALLAKVLFEAPATITDLPAALAGLLPRMTARRRERRPTMDEVERHLAGAPSTGSGPPDPEQPQGIAIAVLCAPPPGDAGADEIVEAARAHGGEVASLADGHLAVLFRAAPASDAARLALHIHALRPSWRLVVAAARPRASGRSPAGDALDRAAALLAWRATRAPLIDDTTAKLLGERFDTGAGDTLLGEREPRGAPPADALARLTALCADATPRAVLVVGPPGAGKSALASAFVAERGRVFRARGEPHLAATPLALATDLVRRAAGVAPGDPFAGMQDKLRALVERTLTGDVGDRVTVFLCELCRAPLPDDKRPLLRHARADPASMAREMRRAFADLLASSCERDPLTLFVDDLHWADPVSVDLLDAALDAAAGRPLLLLGAGRPQLTDVFPAVFAAHDFAWLRLT